MGVVTSVTNFFYKIDFDIFNFVSFEKGTLETLYFHLILKVSKYCKMFRIFFLI